MRVLTKLGLIAVLLGISALCIYAVQDAPTDSSIQEKLVNDYNVYALPIPIYLEFAGEPVPISDPDIRERFDKELLVNTYWQSNALLMIKRAHKYFPVIEPLLKKHGIPDDFKYSAATSVAISK